MKYEVALSCVGAGERQREVFRSCHGVDLESDRS